MYNNHACIYTEENQSTESTDGGGCLNFYNPLELIVIYAEIKKATHKSNTNLFEKKKKNLRAESQACATDFFFNILQVWWLSTDNILMKLTGTRQTVSKRASDIILPTLSIGQD